MKVYLHYSDGSYWAEAYTEKHAKAGLKGIEISDGEWFNYQDFLDISNRWHKWLRDLDNQQYYLEHPEEHMTGE